MSGEQRRHWTDEELAFVRSHYSIKRTSWIAKRVRRSVASIYQVVVKYGIRDETEQGYHEVTVKHWASVLGMTTGALQTIVRRGDIVLTTKDITVTKTQQLSYDTMLSWLRSGGALHCTITADTPRYIADIITSVKAQFISYDEIMAIDPWLNPSKINQSARECVGLGRTPIQVHVIGAGEAHTCYYKRTDFYNALYQRGHLVPRDIKDPYVRATWLAWDSVYIARWQIVKLGIQSKHLPKPIVRGIYNRQQVLDWIRRNPKHSHLAKHVQQDPITWQELHADIDRRKRQGLPI